MQLREVLDLVGRVRRRGRILRLVLAVVGRRLVVGLLLLPGLRVRVVSSRRSGRRAGRHSDNERPPPYTSPETHGELLPVRFVPPMFRSAHLRLSGHARPSWELRVL